MLGRLPEDLLQPADSQLRSRPPLSFDQTLCHGMWSSTNTPHGTSSEDVAFPDNARVPQRVLHTFRELWHQLAASLSLVAMDR